MSAPNYLKQFLQAGLVPVISCIGATEDGAPLNINADTVASKIALAINADSSTLVTDTPGIQIEERFNKQSSPTEIVQWIETGEIYGGMLPKVKAALDCLGSRYSVRANCRSAIRRNHIKYRGGFHLTTLFQNYARRSVHLVKGKGTIVTDDKGKDYLDFTSGIAVVSLGHAHPAIVEAVKKQSEKLWHISNLFESPEQELLAATLVEETPFSHAFFCNSGAEANEAAIKLARKHTQKNVIITFEQSFHGRTFGAMSATGQDKVREGFGPLLETFRIIPYNDEQLLEAAIDDDVAAIMLEVIQGEGGVHQIDPEFAQTITDICKSKGILLIVDEVQTGIGRTGTRYAYEQTNLEARYHYACQRIRWRIPDWCYARIK